MKCVIFYCVHGKHIFLIVCSVVCASSPIDIEVILEMKLICFLHVLQVKVVSPKHRLIKVDSQEFGRCKVPLSPVTVQEEPVRTVCTGALLDFL